MNGFVVSLFLILQFPLLWISPSLISISFNPINMKRKIIRKYLNFFSRRCDGLALHLTTFFSGLMHVAI